MLILAAAGPLILLLAYVIYRLCGIFHPYRAFIKVKKAPPPTAPMIFLTSQELRAYDGTTEGKPIYVAVCGAIYDVTSRSDMYGPGCGYHCFAGYDASRALAKSSFEKADIENSSVSDLSLSERAALRDWEAMFGKYPRVGYVVANEQEREERRRKEEEAQAKKAALLAGTKAD